MPSSAPNLDARPILGIALRLVLDKKSIWIGVAPPTPKEGQQGVDEALTIVTHLYEGYLDTYGDRMDVGETMGYFLDRVPDQARVEFYAAQEKARGSVVTLPEVVQIVRFYRAPPAGSIPKGRQTVRGLALRAFDGAGGGPFWFGIPYSEGSNPGERVFALLSKARAVVPTLSPAGSKFVMLSEEPTDALMGAIEAANLVHSAVFDIVDETDADRLWGPPVDGVH